MSTDQEVTSFEKDTESVLSNTIKGLVEGLTGVATSSRNDLILSVSRTFQRMRGGQFLSTLLEEWNGYRKKGKVKEDYQATEQHKVCLQELLEFLENDSPDETRFNLLKQVFLVAASEEASDRDSLLPQQFMKIARSLSSGEATLLSTIWVLADEKDGDYAAHYSAADWLKEVTEQSGFQFQELVEIHEDGLIKKRLINQRLHADRSGVTLEPHFRLTPLGYEFCRFIARYEA
jgi:hypothetical protein